VLPETVRLAPLARVISTTSPKSRHGDVSWSRWSL